MRQDVKKKPSDKFIRFERHGLLAVIVCIISPQERDIAVPVVEDAVIADGDPVGISADVLENTFRATEGRFAIDDPLLLVKLPPEGFKVPRFLEMTDTAGENEIIRQETFFDKVEELASEQSREDPNRNEKPLAAWHPAASVGG